MRRLVLLGLLLGLGALALAQSPISPVAQQSRVILSAPLTTSGHVNPGPSTCAPAMRCWAEADAGWTCVKADGSAIAVTQGTSPTYLTTGFVPTPGGPGRVALSSITDAKAPSIPAGAAADAGLDVLLAGDHTIVAMVKGGNATNDSKIYSHGAAATDGIYMGGGASSFACVWSNSSAAPTTHTRLVSTAVNAGWVVSACRRSGIGDIGRVNGTASSSEDWTGPVAAPTDNAVWFGRYESAGISLGGELGGLTAYPCALTSAEVARIEAQWFGGLAESRNITTTRATVATNDDGTILTKYGNNAGRVDRTRGLLGYAATANLLANTEALDLWTAVGTPVEVTTTTAYDGTATAETLEDDDGAALEGEQQTVTTTASAAYVLSCWLKAGTQALTRMTNDGTACDKTLTASWARYECADASASDVTTTQQVLIGDEVGDTGTISVWGCQVNLGATAAPYVPCGASACSANADSHTVSNPLAANPTDNWCVEGTVEPLKPYADAVSRTLFEFGTHNVANSSSLYTYNGKVRFGVFPNAGAEKELITTANLSQAPHIIKGCSRAGNLSIWVDNVRQSVTGTATGGIITTHPATLTIGSYSNGTGTLDGHLRNPRVTR